MHAFPCPGHSQMVSIKLGTPIENRARILAWALAARSAFRPLWGSLPTETEKPYVA